MDFPIAPNGPPGKPSASKVIASDQQGGPIPAARGEPSKLRRDLLKKQEKPALTLSNLCSIEKYYATADKLLEQFKAHLANGELDDAYIMGRRFAVFSTVSLPGHDYYTSPKANLVQLRLKNQKDAQWVTRGLERIVEVMDKQEIDRREVEMGVLMKQKEKDDKEQVEWEKSMRQRLGAAECSTLELSSDISTLDTATKLKAMNAAQLPNDHDGLSQPLPPAIPPPPLTMGEKDAALLNSVTATQQLKFCGATPMFAELLSAYGDTFHDRITTHQSASDAELEELAKFESLPMPITPTPKSIQRAPIRILRRQYESELQSLLALKHIEIMKLSTFQGRLGASNPRFDSTNGCTVISPLIVATHIDRQHMRRLNQISATTCASEYGISNSDITEIIDKRAPPILQTVRSRLGLNQHALIIPSDVHDYLVDEYILPQRKFVGVCGGDILDQEHVNKLIAMIVNGKEDKKKRIKPSCRKQRVGAAFFFLEHVITFIKIPLGNGECYYDLIDSLPSPSIGGMATRTRCKDLASFEALLRCYGSSKFNERHCNFIDDNIWNDGMCDFDPRTFQGFVWCEMQ
jgi:hypothetical protein